MEVEQTLEDIISQRKSRDRQSRGGGQREKGASFAKRQAQASRNAKLAQARGTAPRQPRVARNFGATGLLQVPRAAQMMRAPLMRAAPQMAAQPSVVVVPVMSSRPQQRGGRSQPLLTKNAKRQLTQAITQITQRSGPARFISTYTPTQVRQRQAGKSTPRAPQQARRQASKVVRPRGPRMAAGAAPMMMMPAGGAQMMMTPQGPMMIMPQPQMMMGGGARPQQMRQPQRRNPRSGGRGRQGGRR